ncbi:reverse transcriptase domain-containing protein [Trichonephila clavipes]|nr:reverse transcriptase domain-containing protein [Trichonephila clavipes]
MYLRFQHLKWVRIHRNPGDIGKKILKKLVGSPSIHCEGVTLKQVLQEFDKHFLDYQNEIFASFQFLEIKQEQGEKFTDYYSRLRNAVVECNYGESQDRMLRDKLIQELLDKALKESLIRETSKKARALQKVVSECKTAQKSKVRYRFLVLPFGLNSAPEEFLKAMDEIYEDEDINPFFG